MMGDDNITYSVFDGSEQIQITEIQYLICSSELRLEQRLVIAIFIYVVRLLLLIEIFQRFIVCCII